MATVNCSASNESNPTLPGPNNGVPSPISSGLIFRTQFSTTIIFNSSSESSAMCLILHQLFRSSGGQKQIGTLPAQTPDGQQDPASFAPRHFRRVDRAPGGRSHERIAAIGQGQGLSTRHMLF